MKTLDILVIILSSLFIVSLTLAVELLLILTRKLDIEKIKKLKKEMNEKQKSIKELVKKMRESRDEKEIMDVQRKIAKLQNELLANNFKIMKEKLKVSLITWVPVILIFIKLNKYMGGFSLGWFLIYLVSFIILDKIFRKLVKLDY